MTLVFFTVQKNRSDSIPSIFIKYRSEQAKIDRICAYRNFLTINISKQYDLIDLFWLITTLVIDQFFSLHFKLKLAYSFSSCFLLPLRARCHTL